MATDPPDPRGQAEPTDAVRPGGIRPDIPTPNRDRRREPPIIDLEASASIPERSAAAAAARAPAASASGTAAGETTAPPRSERPSSRNTGRRGGAAAIVLAVAALLVACGTAYHLVASQNDATAALNSDIAALQGRVKDLEARADTVPTQASVAGLERRLATAQTAVGGLDQRLAAAETASARSSALDNRVAALESGVAGLRGAVGQVSARTDSLRAEAAKAAAAAAAQASPGAPAPPVDLGPVEDRLGNVEARLTNLEAVLQKPKTEMRATQARVEMPSPAGHVAALAVAAQTLVQALEQGAPYAADLAALVALGANADKTAALKRFAENGAPTPHGLALRFAGRAEAILGTAAPGGKRGFWNRLAGGATGLVSIRKTGEPASEESASLVARINAALDRGNLDEAIVLWGKLPEPAQRASQDWADEAKARAAAGLAAHAILADAVAALGKS